jgi:hypothetical protein
MAQPDPDELKKLKKELASCRRQLKEANAFNERLRSAIGFDELKGWRPQEAIERQYGWVFAWLHPLYSYTNENVGKPLTPDIRNRIQEIATAIIAQLAVSGKYGVTLPFDPRPVDGEAFMTKQQRPLQLIYPPCVICGESRITHDCHILPRTEGGPSHADNFIALCPLHHHLFDHDRLSPEEWANLREAIKGKMEAALVYADQVRLPRLEAFWREKGSTPTSSPT